MTSNQISYWNLKEMERSNKAKEDETKRSNLAKEYETNRSNVVNEQLKSKDIESQIQRRADQSQIETVNAITGGIKNVGTGIGKFLGLFI